jgi:hypothetical protein
MLFKFAARFRNVLSILALPPAAAEFCTTGGLRPLAESIRVCLTYEADDIDDPKRSYYGYRDWLPGKMPRREERMELLGNICQSC